MFNTIRGSLIRAAWRVWRLGSYRSLWTVRVDDRPPAILLDIDGSASTTAVRASTTSMDDLTRRTVQTWTGDDDPDAVGGVVR